MKKMEKLLCGAAAGFVALGLVFRAIGTVGGGRAESRGHEREIISGGHLWPFQVSRDGDGITIGGDGGLKIDSAGIRFDGWSEGDVDGGKEEQIRESGELTGITGVDVDIDYGDIWVRSGETCSVVLNWNFSGYALDYQVENGMLKVESESQRDGTAGSLEMRSKVVVTLPAEMELQELELSTDLGEIVVEADQVTAWETEMDTSLGNVDCYGLTARKLSAESSLGDVTIHFPQSENVGYHLSAQLGTVKVNDTTFQGEGETRLTDKEQKYFVEANTDLGDVTLLY